MMPHEQHLCQQWIVSYVQPSAYIDHMHSDEGLWRMMMVDTRVMLSRQQFRILMHEMGYDPVDRTAEQWEYKISKVPFRMRPKSTISGWTAAAHADNLSRRG